MHQILWEDASRPCRDDHVTKSRNRKLIRVTSSTKGLKHMCVDLSDYNRYLRTQIPHYQHATPEWPNSHKLKIHDGGGRHLEFRKNVNNSELDKDICTKFCANSSIQLELLTFSEIQDGDRRHLGFFDHSGMLIVPNLCSVPNLVQISVIVRRHLMTSRELTSGFDFWSRGHLRMAVVHLPI